MDNLCTSSAEALLVLMPPLWPGVPLFHWTPFLLCEMKYGKCFWLVKWEIKWNCEKKRWRHRRICLLQSPRVAQAWGFNRKSQDCCLRVTVSCSIPTPSLHPLPPKPLPLLIVCIEAAVCLASTPPMASSSIHPTAPQLQICPLSPCRLPYFTISLWASRRVEQVWRRTRLWRDGGEVRGEIEGRRMKPERWRENSPTD